MNFPTYYGPRWSLLCAAYIITSEWSVIVRGNYGCKLAREVDLARIVLW